MDDEAIGVLPAPAPEPGRRNVVLVGTLVGAAGVVALIGALLGGYLSARDVAQADNVAFPPEGTAIPNVALLVTYMGLVLSAFTAHWAYSAIRQDDRKQAYWALGATGVLGACFLNGVSFAWVQLGLVAGSSAYANHVYAVTVTHMVLVVGALITFLVVGFRVFGGQLGRSESELLLSAVVIWDVVVAAGVVIWWTLWFLEGGP
jgi:heme/copper-type cytochrome/quinol oxidase subunit 3